MLTKKFSVDAPEAIYASVFLLGLFLYVVMTIWHVSIPMIDDAFAFFSMYVPMLPHNMAYAKDPLSATFLQVYLCLAMPLLAWVSIKYKFFFSMPRRAQFVGSLEFVLFGIVIGWGWISIYFKGVPLSDGRFQEESLYVWHMAYFLSQSVAFFALLLIPNILFEIIKIFWVRIKSGAPPKKVKSTGNVKNSRSGPIEAKGDESALGEYEVKPFLLPYRVIFEVTKYGVLLKGDLIPWHEINFFDGDLRHGVMVYRDGKKFYRFSLRTFGKKGSHYKGPMLKLSLSYENKDFRDLESFVFRVRAESTKPDSLRKIEERMDDLIAGAGGSDLERIRKAGSELRKVWATPELEQERDKYIKRSLELWKNRKHLKVVEDNRAMFSLPVFMFVLSIMLMIVTLIE